MSQYEAYLDAPPADEYEAYLGPAKPPPKTGVLRGIGDTAISLGQGVVGGVKSLVDVGGTGTKASRVLGDIGQAMEGAYSPARAAERQARQATVEEADASGSTLKTITSRLGGFAEAPIDTLAQGIGSMAPTLIGAIATKGKSIAPRLGIGAGMGVGSIKGGNYDAVKGEALKAGRSEAEAEALATRASEYSRENAPQQVLGGVLGALDAWSGVERLVGGLAGGVQKVGGGLLKRVGKAAAEEAAPEFAQGAQGKYAENEALNRAGFTTDPMSGVLGSGIHDAAVGAVLGGAVGVPRGRQHAAAPATPAQPAAEPAAASAEQPIVQPLPGDEIRAGKLPEGGPLAKAVNAGVESQAQAVDAATAPAAAAGPALLTDDEQNAALFYVEQRRTDGTLAGRRFASLFDAGRIPPSEALRLFLLDQQGADFNLPAPDVEATEISFEDAARAQQDPNAALDQLTGLPVGQATELPVEAVEPAPARTHVGPIARVERSAQPAPAAPMTDPDLVAAYVAQRRAEGTLAGRRFAGDFDAGRIKPADVLALLKPKQTPTADERIAAAAGQAPKPKGGIVVAESPKRKTADAIPVGEVTEVPPTGDVTELESIPVGEASEVIPTGEAAPLPKSIPAGRATEVVPETILADDFLTTDGMPYGSKVAAKSRAQKEGLGPEHLVEIQGAGWVVRPQAAADKPAAEAKPAAAPAAPQDAPAHKVGDLVKLTKPGLNGRVNIAGSITQLLPDGRLEIRTQNDGYMKVAPSELGHKKPEPAPAAASINAAAPATESAGSSEARGARTPSKAAAPTKPAQITVPPSFARKHMVTTMAFHEATGDLQPTEMDAKKALKALDEDIGEMRAFVACLKGS